jgi:hypothetical protein
MIDQLFPRNNGEKMISQKTASRIWECYREIAAGEKLLSDLAEAAKAQWGADHAPQLSDAFGHRRDLQLGIPSGDNCHKLFGVGPALAKSVITAHIGSKRAELVAVNEQARIEVDQ